MLTKNEYEHARIVAASAKKPLNEVIENMTEARDVYGVSFRNYRNIRLYNYTTKTIKNQGERLLEAKEKEEQHYKNVCDATGLTKAQVRQNLAILNDNPYAIINIAQYDELKLYELPWEEKKAILIAVKNTKSLFTELTNDLKQIDFGNETYDNIKIKLNELYKNVEFTLLPSDIEEVHETIEKSCPSLLEDEEKLRATVVDMIVCKRLMGFWDFEYFMFDFMNKTIEERRKFVSNNYRTFKLMQVNDRVKSDTFDNKALTYEMFKDFYYRDAVIINSEADFPIFKDFIGKHETFVAKTLNGAMGVGIKKVQAANADLENLLKDLLDELGGFMCEELIIAHDSIKKLNPDSVNTIRMSTYFDGHKVHMKWPFMKIGRAGSFVDNGGAGGILVAIDEKTGEFISDGIDECCNIYVEHPDSHVVLKGYQLPNWEEALELGKRISMCAYEKIPDVRFIGWDITYTKDNKWVVIEGNAFSQFIGQQAPLGVGVRAELDEIIRN